MKSKEYKIIKLGSSPNLDMVKKLIKEYHCGEDIALINISKNEYMLVNKAAKVSSGKDNHFPRVIVKNKRHYFEMVEFPCNNKIREENQDIKNLVNLVKENNNNYLVFGYYSDNEEIEKECWFVGTIDENKKILNKVPVKTDIAKYAIYLNMFKYKLDECFCGKNGYCYFPFNLTYE